MGQTVSSCCPCLSSEYTEILDDSAPLVEREKRDRDIDKDEKRALPAESSAASASVSAVGKSAFSSSSAFSPAGAATNNSNSSNGAYNNNNINNINNSSASSGRASLGGAAGNALSATVSVAGSRPAATATIEFDLQSPVFKGCVVQQKFFNKSSYEPKFAWINLKSRALCLSEHMTKERRHKEASIADVTGVICGPPEKFKASVGPQGELQSCEPDLCLSVKFIRGGGIDLKFSTMHERDEWADVLLRMIQGLKKHELSADKQ